VYAVLSASSAGYRMHDCVNTSVGDDGVVQERCLSVFSIGVGYTGRREVLSQDGREPPLSRDRGCPPTTRLTC
jgi:hypothetical protein